MTRALAADSARASASDREVAYLLHNLLVNAFRFVIGEQDDRGLFALIRQPGDIVLRAGGWDDVWAACPEFDVPWRSVSFKNDTVRTAVLAQRGEHPDTPR